MKIDRPASGTQARLEDLIALRFAAGKLRPAQRSRALSTLAGSSRSSFRGRGIEFDEVRHYQPGDDIRAIDWRVTARTSVAHTKVFHEERERPYVLLVDQSDGMAFGSRACFKTVMASHLAALLAWSALNQGDRVGALVFNDVRHSDLRPRRSRKTVLALLSLLCEYGAQAVPGGRGRPQRLAEILGNARRIIRPGSSVFLLSDFPGGLDDTASEHLFRLGRHAEITAVHCSDPLEWQLPAAGTYAVSDGVHRSELDTSSPVLRRRYAASAQARLEQLRERCRRLGMPLLEAGTDQAPFQLLGRWYGRSAR